MKAITSAIAVLSKEVRSPMTSSSHFLFITNEDSKSRSE